MNKRDAKNIIAREAAFPTGSRDGFAGFCQYMQDLRASHLKDWQDSAPNRAFDTNDILAAHQSWPPEKFSTPYQVRDEGYETHLNAIQKKYLLRYKNIRRSWARLLQVFPESMKPGRKLRVLEMSTAHGATLEILRHFGHDVVGNDFTNAALHGPTPTGDRPANEDVLADHVDRADWPYRPIVESLGLDVRIFDAGLMPYPFDDDAFDVVLCFDALEHYAHPSDWMKIVSEFCRIASRTVVVQINPVQRWRTTDDTYMDAVAAFCAQMRAFDDLGFECVASGTGFFQVISFKLMRIA